MSGLNSALNMNKIAQYFRLLQSYFKRHNPILEIQAQIESSLKGMLTFKKKVKIARYRVNHLNYRLHQMEELINSNNPHNSKSGRSLNLLR